MKDVGAADLASKMLQVKLIIQFAIQSNVKHLQDIIIYSINRLNGYFVKRR